MKVQFHIEPETKTVMAYFPDLPHNGELRTSYAHIGQHSACHPDYIKDCKRAKPKQYADLLEELKSIGYEDLEVIN